MTSLSFACRESGVRNLRKQIEKIYRKAAFKVGWLENLPNPYLYICFTHEGGT